MQAKAYIELKILFCIGVIIFIFGVFILLKFSQIANWKETEGIIIGSYIRDLPVPETKAQNHLTPDIIYEYKDDSGKTYFSNRISYIDTDFFPRMSDNYYAGSFDQVKAFISNYETGQKVKVYYDPNKPSLAILDRAIKPPVFLPMLVGLLMIYISFHFYIFNRISELHKYQQK